ncbi:diacylglycerol O-acyltransferase, type 1, C-terminal half [Tribonema minus]|uniref:O-acyltransferase n=1 Tax=Tribonema minus TaxID=303371 RepID=A0A836CDX9_9STRA|nr:diacylglycerol O-acyltransferase, type 1, C-terminal half [Tribonema minus]
MLLGLQLQKLHIKYTCTSSYCICIVGVLFLSVLLIVLSKPKRTASKRIPESLLLSLHGLNCTVELCIPLYVVWHYTGAPMFGFAYLFTAVLLWMKLISYAHCNRDLRLAWYHAAEAAKRKDDKADNNSHTHLAAPAQPPALASTAVSGTQALLLSNAIHDAHHVLACAVSWQTSSYPSNISLSNVYYFWFAPTLSYQLNYPKTPCIRWYYVANLAVRCCIALLLMTLIVEQYILPALQTSFHPITRGDLLSTAETLLALCIPSTYVWLLIFYGFFHVLLNLLAELFGDRLFYRDWWNATTIEAYWRLWNLPVHYWMVRHMYFPCLRAGISKTMASVLCFVLSAVFHELLISVPFRMVKFYAFFGMLANVLLVPITKAVDDYCGKGSQAGNWIFWVVFCFVGQPMSVLLYYRDYCSDNHCTMPFAQPHT